MSKIISKDQIRNGDTIRITRTVKVSEVHTWSEKVIDSSGLTYFVSNADSIELIDRPEENPDNWPPQAGDVWRSLSGYEYFITPSDKAMSSVTGIYSSFDQLKSYKPVLIHRKGNDPK